MATVIWQSGAPAVAQVDTITVSGDWATNDTATITCALKSITFTVAGTQTAAAVVTGLVAAWNASTVPEHAEITAADGAGDTITMTADTAGVPFTISVSENTAGTGALSNAATTASAGPDHWSTAANWDTGAVPVNTNDVFVDTTFGSIYYGLAQSGVTLASLKFVNCSTGTVGLPEVNAAGYPEYRDTYLAIGATLLKFDCDSGRIKVNTGTAQTAASVLNAGTALETDIPSLLWKGTHASSTVDVLKGSFGAAALPGEVATILTLKIGYRDSLETDADVYLGSGVTLGTVTKNGGQLHCDNTTAALTALTQTAGETWIDGKTNAVTALNIYGGPVHYNTSGTLTAGVVGGNATLDFRGDMRAKTVSAIQVYAGAAIYDPAAVVTWTTGLDLMASGLEDCSLQIGKHRTWTPTAI